jgi:hypothetical protein
MVHHMGHVGERSRGASRLRDWPDVEWQLVREGSAGEQADARRFFKAYGRDVEVSEGLLQYDAETRHLTLAGGNQKETAADALIPEVLGYLDDHAGASGRQIGEAFKSEPRAQVRSAIKRAIAGGLIRIEFGERRAIRHFVAEPSAPSAP